MYVYSLVPVHYGKIIHYTETKRKDRGNLFLI